MTLIGRRSILSATTAGLASGWAVPAVGQSTDRSSAERAQRLAKIEEDLNSVDPNLRLATLEFVMENGSLAEQVKAMSICVLGSDRVTRDLAFRYGMSKVKTLAIRTGPGAVEPGARNANHPSAGPSAYTVAIEGFDVGAGSFVTRGVDGNYATARLAGSGQVLGNALSFSVGYSTGTQSNNVLVGSLGLRPDGTLAGTVNMTGNAITPPLAAVAPFITALG